MKRILFSLVLVLTLAGGAFAAWDQGDASRWSGVSKWRSGFIPSDIPQAEADALIAFYDATGGDSWTDSTGWGSDTTVDNWTGVTVTAGHVTGINLSGDSNINGDCTDLVDLTSLTSLRLYNTSVSGDISGFSTRTSLTYLDLGVTSVSGDISGFSALTSLTYLRLNDTSVEGDISGFNALTSLITFHLGDTSVEGDISGFNALTSLTYLRLNDTSVDGNISGFSALTSLTYLNLGVTSVSYTGTLSDWHNGVTRIEDLSWSAATVDNFLADLDATGVTDGTLNISGTNAAPTDGSVTGVDGLTARDNLVTDGWVVTVSE